MSASDKRYEELQRLREQRDQLRRDLKEKVKRGEIRRIHAAIAVTLFSQEIKWLEKELDTDS